MNRSNDNGSDQSTVYVYRGTAFLINTNSFLYKRKNKNSQRRDCIKKSVSMIYCYRVSLKKNMNGNKRIGAVPNDFKLGENWVFVAHSKAGIDSEGNPIPAIFYCFKPQRIEKIVTEAEFEDKEEMEKLEKRGVTPFVVDDTGEHKGNVFDAKKPIVDTLEKWLRYL